MHCRLKDIALSEIANLAQCLKILFDGFSAETPSDYVINV